MLLWAVGGAGMAAAQEEMSAQPPSSNTLERATFAGGCFWCMEGPFEQLPGVLSVTAGYTGGREPNPTYGQVSSGKTGHAEAVQIVYDPSRVSYGQLLDVFWRQIDPTTPNRQFADKGAQYRSAIFTHGEEQRRLAEASKAALAASGTFDKPLVTEITPVLAFYPAEEYHQDYYKTHALQYQLYRIGSGRDGFLKRHWPEVAH
jgi:methionine-S-sulfoxide reductase